MNDSVSSVPAGVSPDGRPGDSIVLLTYDEKAIKTLPKCRILNRGLIGKGLLLVKIAPGNGHHYRELRQARLDNPDRCITMRFDKYCFVLLNKDPSSEEKLFQLDKFSDLFVRLMVFHFKPEEWEQMDELAHFIYAGAWNKREELLQLSEEKDAKVRVTAVIGVTSCLICKKIHNQNIICPRCQGTFCSSRCQAKGSHVCKTLGQV